MIFKPWAALMEEYIPIHKWWKVSNGLDDFKVALYICPNHIDDGIYSDHGYLDTLDNPLGPP